MAKSTCIVLQDAAAGDGGVDEGDCGGALRSHSGGGCRDVKEQREDLRWLKQRLLRGRSSTCPVHCVHVQVWLMSQLSFFCVRCSRRLW